MQIVLHTDETTRLGGLFLFFVWFELNQEKIYMKIVCSKKETCNINTLQKGDVFRDADRDVMMVTSAGYVNLESGEVWEKNVINPDVIPLPDAKLITGED